MEHNKTYTTIVIADISCSMPYGSSFKTIAEKYLGKASGIVASIQLLPSRVICCIIYKNLSKRITKQSQ